MKIFFEKIINQWSEINIDIYIFFYVWICLWTQYENITWPIEISWTSWKFKIYHWKYFNEKA